MGHLVVGCRYVDDSTWHKHTIFVFLARFVWNIVPRRGPSVIWGVVDLKPDHSGP